MQQKTVTARGTLFAALLIVCSGVLAPVGAEELPLYLTLSQGLTRDSNLLRDNTYRREDTVSTTSLTAGINKAYGRQNYRLSATASRNSYKENKQFDNDGYSVNAEVTSEVGANWQVTVSGSASQFLPNFEDQFDRSVSNTERGQQASLDVRYGLYGRWSVNGGVSHSKVDFKVTQQENKSSNSVYAGVRYLPSNLAYIGLTLTRSDTDVPNRVLLSTAVVGEKIERTSLSADTMWQVSGFSRLSARLAATSEKHPQDRRRDFDGVTGSASWQFTPAGKVSYALNLIRDTSNEGGYTRGGIGPNSVYSTNNRLTNNLSATATWNATAKLKFNAGYTYAVYEEDKDLVQGAETFGENKKGRYNAVSLGVSYQPIQAVGLGCDMQRYDRTASFSRAYDGNTVSCSASFTLD